MKNLGVLIVNIPSNQDATYSISVEDLTSTGIREEILLVILSCFWNITLVHLFSQMTLLSLL